LDSFGVQAVPLSLRAGTGTGCDRRSVEWLCERSSLSIIGTSGRSSAARMPNSQANAFMLARWSGPGAFGLPRVKGRVGESVRMEWHCCLFDKDLQLPATGSCCAGLVARLGQQIMGFRPTFDRPRLDAIRLHASRHVQNVITGIKTASWSSPNVTPSSSKACLIDDSPITSANGRLGRQRNEVRISRNHLGNRRAGL